MVSVPVEIRSSYMEELAAVTADDPEAIMAITH